MQRYVQPSQFTLQFRMTSSQFFAYLFTYVVITDMQTDAY